MKLTGVLLIAACMQVSAAAYSQKITLSERHIPLEKVFRKIMKQSDYMFLYNDESLLLSKNISINVKAETIERVLDACFNGQPVTYTIYDKTVVVRPKTEMYFNQAPRPPATVTGKIVDEKNQPVPGVNVMLKGSKAGVVTNLNGEFSIVVPEESLNGGILVVQFLGYKTQEVAINGRGPVSVKLTPDIKALDEVVIVGYNTVRKIDVTGSVATIGAEEIRSRPVSNAIQAMQGKVAGVDITSNERPGEVGRVRIRGARSLTASNDPLYVVDGIPLSSGGIEAINPNDIESINVLKDASATAVYGSRGANGVVMVTTKRGKAGSLALNYVGTSTIEHINDRMEMMNAGEYLNFRRDSYRRITYLNQRNGTTATGGYPDGPATQALDQSVMKLTTDQAALANFAKGWTTGTFVPEAVETTDWTGMVTKTGVTHDHTVSVSGGTDKLNTYGSFGYLKQDGTQLGQDYDRYSAKFSVEVNPVKWFKMGGNITGTYGVQNFGFSTTNATGPGTLYSAALGMLPYTVPYDANGNRINLPGADVGIISPIGEENYNDNLRKTLRTLGSLYAEVNILKGLKYRANFGPDFYNFKNGRWMDERSINRGGGEPGSTNYAELNQTQRFSYTLDNLLYYDKSIGKHNFGVTGLYSATSYRQETANMKATKLPWNAQKWYQLNSVSALDGFSTGLTESSLLSYMARVNYSYNSKYLLTASARWDGASQLAAGNKWDFFPSLALAWRIDQEKFVKNIDWISELKLRAGVGSTGNAAISPYTTKGGVQTLYYTFGASVVPGYVSSDASLATPNSLPNIDLGWEHTTQYNFGVDFGFLHGRVNGAIDFYLSNTTDLLLNKSIPSVNGYVTTLANVGETANRGLDVSVNTINLQKKSFSWSSTLNFSASKDRIIELSNGKNSDIGNLWFIGESLSSYYDYEKDRIWQNTPEDLADIAKFKANGNTFNPGDIKVKDLNGDFKIDANNDRQIRGQGNPTWNAGLSNTFTYKNWDLTVFMFSRWGFTLPVGAEVLQGRYAQRKVDYWTPTNPTNEYPAPNYNSAAGDPYRTSMNYQLGSFIKVRDISLAYIVPASFSKKISLSRVKVYAQVLNPGFIYSKIDFLDPDVASAYISNSVVQGGSASNKGFVFGLNVGF